VGVLYNKRFFVFHRTDVVRQLSNYPIGYMINIEMQLLNYQIPNNPLKLLDDYLSSIPIENNDLNVTEGCADVDKKMMDDSDSDQRDVTTTTPSSSSSLQSPATTLSTQAEQLHNSVLRVAAELFGNNISLLENSLALLEEQEQYQHNSNDNNDDNHNNNKSLSSSIPPIRTIRARRSGRVAVIVRKQQKKSRASSYHPQQQSDKQIMNDYYLCLLGRDKISIDNTNSFKTSKGTYHFTPHHRIGMHCTCRSFFHNIKGSGSSSGGGGKFKSNGERSPSVKASYRGSSNSNSSSSNNNNIVVCKHLLAVVLMPHLLPWRAQSVEEDVVDDKLFAKLVMRASIG
jgi:hypothetical protein